MQSSCSYYISILLRYLQPLWHKSLLLLILLLIGIGLRLLNPQILATFIDTAMSTTGYAYAGAKFSRLIQLALLFLGIALATGLISLLETYLAADIGLRATNRLRANLTLHCLQLDMSFHNNQTPGALIERIDGDVSQLNDFFSRFAIDFVGNSIFAVGVFIALFHIDWRIGLTAIAMVVILLFTFNHFNNIVIPYFQAERASSAALFGFLAERLSGTEDVRSSGASAYVMHRFYERSRDLFPKLVKSQTFGLGVFSAWSVFFTLGKTVILGMSIVLFFNNAFAIGTVYLIYRYIELLEQPIQQFGRQVQDLQEAEAALIRVRELLTTQSRLPDIGQTTLPDKALSVRFENVDFRYPTPDRDAIATQPDLVLRDVSFSLLPDTILGLLGRTGSGKTTITRLLLRLYDPTQGTIRLGGVNLLDIPLATLREHVGMVTQEIQLFHASVRDNLTLFESSIPDQRIESVIQEVGLWDWYESLPSGLDTLLAPGGSGLSAGQAQLLAFVRVFLKNPGLVILDEASSRLDPVTEHLLEKAIDRLLVGRTAIIIAHRLATVKRADQIMILEDGHCLECGQRQELATNPDSRFAQLLQIGLEEALA
ncbi:ABC transporter ATP-binding protein [Nostoc sp. 'Lobaria pulmonaria (5183) cyanobiont']|uniref:ABC transporter ATP-binding protein n=1 Tax=Nostoc sp. 'Lobaria pulmonaria (5183) cyanobiont' TaxID=1618022 RepID=UPI000CF2FFF9|nr:ABC transporter ATP-binding protein [Nostoc sp. 'Lobaria pulmonaria (5183) cyanobiont']AVH69237.1 ABC transporter ATP-binding permease [Nostoc sp. 'Lobaria pulmonaria (5183) cyanobiont']